MDPREKPKLRPLMFMKTRAQGKEYIVAQDPAGGGQPLLLPADIEGLLAMLDGKNSIRDIQAQLMRATGGQIVPIDDITQIIDELDSYMLLDSPRYRDTLDLEIRFWNSAGLRKPSHAGQSYPADEDEIRTMINGLYTELEKNGDTGAAASTSAEVRGLLAPHIDIRNGGLSFARAYRHLRNGDSADLHVLIGTAHGQITGPISISRKDYMTPLGVLETDNAFIDSLLDKYSPQWLTQDSAHQTEHSIEFQTVFLQHALGENVRPMILPILVGSFGEFVEERRSPGDDEEVGAFLSAFRKVAESYDGRVVYIVGGDLAHIGPRYGDRANVLQGDVEACLKKDREMLEAAIEGAEEFFDYVSREDDRRNICGMPPLYVMLKLIEGSKGEILDLTHWYDDATRSAVTFGSMVFR